MTHAIGSKIRYMRKQKKMTLSEMAEQTRLSIGFLSNVERDLCSPTLENMQRICLALEIPLVKLLSTKIGTQVVVHPNEREVAFEQKGQVRYESINFGSGKLDGLVIVLEPHCEFKKEWTHAFDEIGIVLEGELEMTIDGEAHSLSCGDAIYVEAMKPHALSNRSDAPCSSFWVKQITDKHI